MTPRRTPPLPLLRSDAAHAEADKEGSTHATRPSSTAAAIRQFKAALSKIKRRTKFITWRESGAYSNELSRILLHLKEGVTAPRTGVELVASFFRADDKIFAMCDDSSGNIGQVFTFDACDLFVHYAAQCDDKEWLAALVLELYQVDSYGVRDCLFDAASKYLPESAIRWLIDRLWVATDGETKIYNKRHWLFRIESLARQIHDVPLLERALRASGEGEIHIRGCLDIARACIDAGDAPSALSWLDQVPDTSYDSDKCDELLLEVHKKLGNRRGAAETAWRIFRRWRHEQTFKMLLENIGPNNRKQLVDEETGTILKSVKLSYTDTRFLIWLGRTDDAEAYLFSHLSEINGNHYADILPIADLIEEAGKYLLTSLLYRALLESILARAISKYYTHGVRYLRKLDTLAPKVEEWREFVDHEEYFASLEKTHARKSSFWERYRSPRGRRRDG